MKDALDKPFGDIFQPDDEGLAAKAGHPPAPFVETGGSGGALLFTAPHAGRHYPPELLSRTRLSIERLRRLEDPLIDVLIGPAAAAGTTTIAGTYARAWIDLNRRETEMDARQMTPAPPAHADHRSPRVSAGLGLVPRTAGDGRPIYDQLLPLEAVTARIRQVHRPYHHRIAQVLAEKHARNGIAMLCDMHSMPSLPPSQAADVVIGDRHGRTCGSWLTDAAHNWLTENGLRVTRNQPYAGGHGVERHGSPANAVHALQFEFDRRLYLNLDNVSLNAHAMSLSMIIAGLAAMLHGLLAGAADAHRLAAE